MFAPSPRSVNLGNARSLPERPAEAPPACPECLDECCWVLNTHATAYFPICAWCSGQEFGGDFDPADDFHDADTVCEPTPLGRGGKAVRP